MPESLPESFSLDQNYPNPFNAATTIIYTLSRPGPVKLQVFDPGGRLVQTVLDEQQTTGRHVTTFDARDLAAGRYHYRLETEAGVRTEQMMVLK